MLGVENLWLRIEVGFGTSGMHAETLASVRARAVKTTVHTVGQSMDDMVQTSSTDMRASLYLESQGYLVRRSH